MDWQALLQSAWQSPFKVDRQDIFTPVIIAGAISLIGILINLVLNYFMQLGRFEFEAEQAKRKTDAEILLLNKRFDLETDRQLQGFAEELLTGFAQARLTLMVIRERWAWDGEGGSRPRQDGETDSEANTRDAYYAVIERLERERKVLSDLVAKQYRAEAWFGPAAADPFKKIAVTLMRVRVSANQLRTLDFDDRFADTRRHCEAWIWTAPDGEPDEVNDNMNKAYDEIDRICRPILARRAGD